MKYIEIPTETNALPDNKYLAAILTAFKEFLQEEAAGNVYTEVRLEEKIKAARILYFNDRDRLDEIVKTDEKLSNRFYKYTKPKFG